MSNDQGHRDGWGLSSHIGDARGMYNPMQFVVRLHDDVHAELNDVPIGIGMRSVTGKQALALSTYFHETIHWWQHVGSTLGLFLSLAYPAQAHINYLRLKRLLRDVGPVKPLVALDRARPNLHADTRRELNIVLNNWHDIEFAVRLAIAPDHADTIINHPYFDSIGHSYEILWGNVVLLIREAIDPVGVFMPSPQDWEEPFHDVRVRRVPDYFWGSSPIELSRIGAKLIFEGQARFAQLQSLHFAYPEADWSLFDSLGMLQPYYTAAFETFLTLTELPWPTNPGGPEVALFLAICDIAINPTEGFPFQITQFDAFRHNVDPGIRFVKLCRAVLGMKSLAQFVSRFSREDYEEVSGELTKALGWHSPLVVSEEVAGWKQHSSVAELLEEDRLFRFANRDLPIRVFVARFLDLQRDKFAHPELLVWPGAFTGSHRVHALPEGIITGTFARHAPLFVDVAGGEVRPALLTGRDHDAIYETFNSFYAYSASYQLVRQWYIAEGPFTFDFGWLSPEAATDDVTSWAKGNFSSVFGRTVDEFAILTI